jgi:flagellar hook-basal body complex protein FliE
MTDPLGLINPTTPARPVTPGQRAGGAGGPQGGPAFKDVLMQQIQDVNKMQAEAERAVEDLGAGRRDDMAQVLMAQQKADLAFQMLLQVRNKVMDAYQEIKDIRV